VFLPGTSYSLAAAGCIIWLQDTLSQTDRQAETDKTIADHPVSAV